MTNKPSAIDAISIADEAISRQTGGAGERKASLFEAQRHRRQGKNATKGVIKLRDVRLRPAGGHSATLASLPHA